MFVNARLADDVSEGFVVIVFIQMIGLVISVNDMKIQAAVIIEVNPVGTETITLTRHTSLGCYFFKFSISQIFKQLIGRTPFYGDILIGSTNIDIQQPIVIEISPDQTRGGQKAEGIGDIDKAIPVGFSENLVAELVLNAQLKIAVIIKIEPMGVVAPAKIHQSDVGGDIFKNAILQISIQHIGLVIAVADKQIQPAIVIVIQPDSTDAFASMIHASLAGDVGEIGTRASGVGKGILVSG